MSTVFTESVAFIAELSTAYAQGPQVHIRHLTSLEGREALEWCHPATLADLCNECRKLQEAGVFEELVKAAKPGDLPPPV